ncbi:hypothetical protein JCM10908_002477 [Rhodotorula pacifica]|uniref:uncharacterized protein n=1 Tax=Rhodotorula pacifica TaxID=1495444 RepID=UPI003179C48A
MQLLKPKPEEEQKENKQVSRLIPLLSSTSEPTLQSANLTAAFAHPTSTPAPVKFLKDAGTTAKKGQEEQRIVPLLAKRTRKETTGADADLPLGSASNSLDASAPSSTTRPPSGNDSSSIPRPSQPPLLSDEELLELINSVETPADEGDEPFEPDFEALLQDLEQLETTIYERADSTTVDHLSDQSRLSAHADKVVEEALSAMVSTGIELKEKDADNVLWQPPADGGAATRTHATVPDLDATPSGDLVVGAARWPTYSLGVEREAQVRLGSTYANSLPRAAVIILLAPFGFEKGLQLSRKERWETAHLVVNSVGRSTLEAYGLFVVRWLEWCERKSIPPEQRFPANPRYVIWWLSGVLHQYSQAYAAKHLQGIAAWHEAHLLAFEVDNKIKRRIFAGAKAIGKAPKEPRRPATIADLAAVRDYLAEEAENDSSLLPRSLCILAAFVFGFFSMARCKEVTIARQLDSGKPTKKKKTSKSSVRTVAPSNEGDTAPAKKRKTMKQAPAFDKKYDATIEGVRFVKASDDLPPMVRVKVPWDKVRKEKGSFLYAAQQSRVGEGLDPVEAMRRHIEANVPSPKEPLFTFRGTRAPRVALTRSFFRKKINEALAANKRPLLRMHGMRIRGANFFKLAGMDSEIIKTQGRWASSSSYQRYQRAQELTARSITADLTAPEDLVQEGQTMQFVDESSSSSSDGGEGDDPWEDVVPDAETEPSEDEGTATDRTQPLFEKGNAAP